MCARHGKTPIASIWFRDSNQPSPHLHHIPNGSGLITSRPHTSNIPHTHTRIHQLIGQAFP
uniref:Uncharacterized protein n=1 Tax=Arundo donax TaxID=35708 RepID=A0A0A8ZZE6_ARUDO